MGFDACCQGGCGGGGVGAAGVYVIEIVAGGVGVIGAGCGEGGHREFYREVLIGLAGCLATLVVVGGEEVIEAGAVGDEDDDIFGWMVEAYEIAARLGCSGAANYKDSNKDIRQISKSHFHTLRGDYNAGELFFPKKNLGAFVFAVKAYNLTTGADDELFSRQYREGGGV